MHFRNLPAALWVLLGAIALTLAVYWPGLRGPLLFDDYWNLTPVFKWQAGTGDALATLLPNRDSLVYSRPVAMGSFMLSVWLGGLEDTFPLKFGNLLIHLACGLLVAWVLMLCLRRDPRLAARAPLLAAGLSAVWLLHPLQVSTVLYAVQRMAQLSTMFTLAAVGCFLVGRVALERGAIRKAWAWLFLACPALVLAGLLSKQNAAIAPFLCLVLELAYFQNPGILSNLTHPRRARGTLALFFGASVLLPLAAALALLLVQPERLLAGYADLEFNLWQRLLSQPRALVDYLGMWLLPRSPQMGLYTDDFTISTGLWSPATTLPALFVLLGLTAGAIVVRRRAPSVFAGWGFFLVAHGIESSFLPLELYYEHRNYLPSLGLLLAAAGMVDLLPPAPGKRDAQWRAAYTLTACFLAVITVSTLGRVLVWQNERSMVNQGLAHHPASLRLRLDAVALSLREGNPQAALDVLEPLKSDPRPRHRLMGNLESAVVQCEMGNPVKAELLNRAMEDAMPHVTVNEVGIAKHFETVTRRKSCEGIDARDMARALAVIADKATAQPDNAGNKLALRRYAAQLYARGGDWRQAEIQARKAWQASPTLPSGAILARVLIKNWHLDEARELLSELQLQVRPYDTPWKVELNALHRLLEEQTGLEPQER